MSNDKINASFRRDGLPERQSEIELLERRGEGKKFVLTTFSRSPSSPCKGLPPVPKPAPWRAPVDWKIISDRLMGDHHPLKYFSIIKPGDKLTKRQNGHIVEDIFPCAAIDAHHSFHLDAPARHQIAHGFFP